MKLREAPSDAAGWYYATVGRAVADVPWRRRGPALADLAERLRALDADASPTTELGPPEEYAAAVRADAGLGEQPGGFGARLAATRPRTKVLAAAGAVVVVVLFVALIGVLRYQPLRTDGSAQALDPAIVIDDAGGVKGLTLRFEPGGEILVRYSITNGGLVDVHVDGVEIEKRFPVRVKELRIVREGGSGDFGAATPVGEFDVRPDEEIVLYAVLEMTDPLAPPCTGCEVTYEIPDLDTHNLGIGHDVDEPGHSVTIRFPEAGGGATGT